MITTKSGVPLDTIMLKNYLNNLVNLFFKILPIKESEEATFLEYVRSLQLELLGCKELIDALHNDSHFLSLISILQFLIDNPNTGVGIVKREVFKCISICNKLKSKYAAVTTEGG